MYNDLWKNSQAGCDEVAIQEIQNHIPKQSNIYFSNGKV